MTRFSVISVDMFGTLADLGSVRHDVWREFLGTGFTEEKADRYWNRANELVFGYFRDTILGQGRYVPPKTVFEDIYTELFREIGLAMDPKKAAGKLAYYHAHSKLFDDVEGFLAAAADHIPVCLSSDTDEDMLGPLRDCFPFDSVFTSEELGVYKSDPEGRFFQAVVDHYCVEPSSILHVGDSVSDIAGAAISGLTTCWVNRNRETWAYEITPDIVVTSLAELEV